MQPEISVIVPAFNVEKFLRKTVESILSVDLESIEVVIVDDGSTDKTWTIAQNLASLHPQRIRVHQHDQARNRGVSASRNLGIAKSKGELIAFLDGDDLYLPHRFTKSVAILESKSQIDAVYERCDFASVHQESDTWSTESNFGIQEPLAGRELMASLIRGIPWHTSAVLLRRSLLERTGNFDESISIAEDCHLWMRMVAIGNVVPGEFTQAVSLYCRRDGSLYRPSIERKWDYWIAVKMFCEWSIAKPATPISYLSIVEMAQTWLDNAIVECRKSQNNKLARRMITSSFPTPLASGMRRRLISHYLRSLLANR
jgi:glycosyltransferase involved in cell wall biosynthesis